MQIRPLALHMAQQVQLLAGASHTDYNRLAACIRPDTMACILYGP